MKDMDQVMNYMMVIGIKSLFWAFLSYGFKYLPKTGAFIILRGLGYPMRALIKVLIYVLKIILVAPVVWFFKKMLWKWRQKKFNSNLYLTLEQIDCMDLVKGSNGNNRSGKWFEEYVASLYRALGHEAKTTTEMRETGELSKIISKKGGSGEQGVDVVVKFNGGDSHGKVLLIQCKHYSNNVGNSAIQEIVSAKALYSGDGVAVVTNRDFTKSAVELAEANGVILINRSRLQHIIEKACESKNINNKVA